MSGSGTVQQQVRPAYRRKRQVCGGGSWTR